MGTEANKKCWKIKYLTYNTRFVMDVASNRTLILRQGNRKLYKCLIKKKS